MELTGQDIIFARGHGESYDLALAAELRGHAARLELEQLEVARLLDRSQAYVSHRFRGKASWELREFFALCAAMDLEPKEVIESAISKSDQYHDFWDDETRERKRAEADAIDRALAENSGRRRRSKTADDFYLAAKTHDDGDDAPLEST